MINTFLRLVRDESGVTAIEYGVIGSMMAVAVIAAINILGPALSTAMTTISTDMTGAAPAAK